MPYKVRRATATWQGGLKDGNGEISLQSGAYKGPYNFISRFEEGPATNPEELVGAAHAGCYAMFLSSLLEKNGTPAADINAVSAVRLDFGGEGGPTVTKIALTLKASVPGIDDSKFQEIAVVAKEQCPISKSLGAVAEMTLDAKLE